MDNEKELTPHAVDLPEGTSERFGNIDILKNVCFALIGPTGKGKSYAMREWCYLNRNRFTDCIVVSKSAKFNHYWDPHVPTRKIFADFDETLMKLVRNEQQKKLDTIARVRPDLDFDGRRKACATLVILDDIVSDHQFVYSPAMLEFMYQGRHMGVFFLLSMQYGKAVKPGFRDQLGRVAVINGVSREALRGLYESHGVSCSHEREFADTARKVLGEKYQMLLIEKDESSDDPRQSMFRYKCKDVRFHPEILTFKMCISIPGYWPDK